MKREVKMQFKKKTQPHDRACFEPIWVEDMTPEEKWQAQIAVTHLIKKQGKSIEERTVHKGKPTQEWLSREEFASPTASMEGMFLTALSNAWEQ